mgnify:CR=1 FL=1
MAKPGTRKFFEERRKKRKAKRGSKGPSSMPAPMPTDRLPDPYGRTTAYGGGRMKYADGGMPKAKYGITNELRQKFRAPMQPKPNLNKFGETIGATGLSKREQMGATQNRSGQKRMMMNKGGMVKAKPC